MKKLVTIFIVLLITITLSTVFYFQSFKPKKINAENEFTIPQTKIVETISVNQEIENTEEEKNVDEIKETKDIPKVEEKVTTNQSSINQAETKSNQLKPENKTELNETKPQIKEEKAEMPVNDKKNNEFIACSQEDPIYKSNLNAYKQSNSSSRMYSSLDEAISFGESAMAYGYGYFYSRGVTSIAGTNCSKEFYTVRLYIPAKTCGDNEMQYISADTPLVDIITYLQQKGYSCPEKNVN